jgi:hypothetical protein
MVNVPLYWVFVAPEIVTCWPVERDAVDATVAVAVVPLRVNDVTERIGTRGAVPKVRVESGSGVIVEYVIFGIVQLPLGHVNAVLCARIAAAATTPDLPPVGAVMLVGVELLAIVQSLVSPAGGPSWPLPPRLSPTPVVSNARRHPFPALWIRLLVAFIETSEYA